MTVGPVRRPTVAIALEYTVAAIEENQGRVNVQLECVPRSFLASRPELADAQGTADRRQARAAVGPFDSIAIEIDRRELILVSQRSSRSVAVRGGTARKRLSLNQGASIRLEECSAIVTGSVGDEKVAWHRQPEKPDRGRLRRFIGRVAAIRSRPLRAAVVDVGQRSGRRENDDIPIYRRHRRPQSVVGGGAGILENSGYLRVIVLGVAPYGRVHNAGARERPLRRGAGLGRWRCH